ncbi:MAG: FkbM family methyltransferase [Clostridia bacterium]|nr:FkbM family methyltransferase [Clostridia bacterium]
MDFECRTDLWEHLAGTKKTIVLYGMGNGAEKILAACAQRGIEISAVFASDGFVRGHSFRGMPVRTWSEIKELYGADGVIVLLAFGSSRPEVLECIDRVAREAELYAPDVPAFGDGLFDRAFFEAHREELDAAYALLSDAESRKIFENVLRFKLTGDVSFLKNAESDEESVMRELVAPHEKAVTADLGAYNGDSIRQLLSHADGTIQTVYAMEPDARNFRKLEAYAKAEVRAKVLPFPVGAWDREETLYFDGSGNRNASLGENRSSVIKDRPIRQIAVPVAPLDRILDGAPVDYIKYDVEGAEARALYGSVESIRKYRPTLLVSLYHRNEDIFSLPLLVHRLFPHYREFYLRRFRGIPAWDLNLYVK